MRRFSMSEFKTGHFFQMGVAELPLLTDLPGMKESLYRDYGIEIPLVEWGGRHFIRISVQGYNTAEDVEKLVAALETLLPRFRVSG